MEFSAAEVMLIRDWGKERNETGGKWRNETGHAIKMQKAGLESHVEGVAGEYAVAGFLGGKWEPLGGKPDEGADILLLDGRTCAVKFRRFMAKPKVWDRGSSISSKKVAPRFATHTRMLLCDVGVLVQEVPGAYGKAVEIVGWISKEEFNDPKVHHLYDFGRGLGPQPAVYDFQLHPIEKLREALAA